jgi:hypothetical protein
VGIVDGGTQPLEDGDDLLAGKPLALFFQRLQTGFERGAIDELHDHVVQVLLDVEVEYLDDIGMP